jgi:4-amino-4-deoxy-L-arabinose transferase-like glycosyltransferase
MTLLAGRDGVEEADQIAETRRYRWHTWALVAICVLAAVLYAWRITSEGWGNPYYAAAVKSMSENLTNLVFGSFDPVGVITVDKPPLAFWAMVLSTTIFGFHSWSVLLPQVIEGVAAVYLLHRTVLRWAGPNAALIAALVLALTPVTVAIDRDSNPDTMMVLVLVIAAYAFTRCIEHDIANRGGTWWLMLSALFLGLGFLAKMLQAWIVVPAFVIAYLVASTVPWGRRIVRLIGAAVVMLIGSMWWVVLVGLWPQPKPYIGGSTNGSVMNLVIGYNGLGRIFGSSAESSFVGGASHGGAPGGHAAGAAHAGQHGGGFGGGMGGQAGLTRMFNQQAGGQISWLLPLAALVLVVMVVLGVRWMRAKEPGDAMRRAGWFLWGGWLVMVGGVLSFMADMFHPYYTSEMAPAIAAVVGAGLPVLWKLYRKPGGYSWLLLPLGVVLTAGWAWVLVSRDLSWNGWLRYAVAVVAVLAVVVLVLGRLAGDERRGALRLGFVLSLIAVLLAPGVWSAATAFATSGGGAMAMAGPPNGMFGGRNRTLHIGDQTISMKQIAGRMHGMQQGTLTPQERNLLNYAQSHSSGAQIDLAVEGGAMPTEPYLLSSNDTVIGMGGFSGGDPAPTVSQLAQWVKSGQLHFVLISSRGGFGRGGAQRGSQPGAKAQQPHGGMGGFGRSVVAQQREQWVQKNCTVVNPKLYGGTPASANQPSFGPFGGGTGTLYECQA